LTKTGDDLRATGEIGEIVGLDREELIEVAIYRRQDLFVLGAKVFGTNRVKLR
jgi:hypothetical protein